MQPRSAAQVLTTLNAANPTAVNGPINIFSTLRARGVIVATIRPIARTSAPNRWISTRPYAANKDDLQVSLLLALSLQTKDPPKGDVTGKWKLAYTTPDGPEESTADLTMDKVTALRQMIDELRRQRNRCEPKSNQNPRYLRYSNAVSNLLWLVADIESESS